MIEWLLVACAPLVFFRVYGIERFYLLSGADPFIYTGYSVSMSDLINRLGYPYYAVRFGLIIPSNLASEVFGVVGGYYVLRWFVAVLAAGLLFQYFRLRYSSRLGVLAVLVLLINPIFIRALMTMYSTTVGVPFICAATALLLMPGSPRLLAIARLSAGILLGLTVHSNPFTAMPIAAALVVWVIVRATVDRRKAMAESAFVVGGAVVVTLVGVAVYWLRFGDPNIFSPSIDAARSISDEAQFPGTELTHSWLNFRPEVWLTPIASLLLYVCTRLVRRPVKWFERAAILMPIAMWLFLAFHEFVLNGYMLETYYYSSYLLGPTVLSLVMCVGLLGERWTNAGRWPVRIAAAALLLAPPLWTRVAPNLSVYTMNGVIPILAITAGMIALSLRRVVFAVGAAVSISLLLFIVSIGSPRNVPLSAGQPFRQDARYFQVFNNYDDSKMDLFQLSTDFALSIPRTERDPGAVVFWLKPDDNVATLVQWTYVGPYTSLQSSTSPAMPLLDDNESALLLGRTPRFVVILGTDPATVQAGEDALLELGLHPIQTSRPFFRRGIFSLYASVNEFVPSACDLARQGDPVLWFSLQPCG